MSRTKKSRKPASAPIAKPKLSKQELAKVEKRIRKKTGKQSGNRQQEALQSKSNSAAQRANRDPRLGNKTPIALGKLTKKVEEKSAASKATKLSPIAAVRAVSSDVEAVSAEQELANIEQDEALQAILAKQDEGIELTEQEVDHFNSLMQRHQELSEQLGIEENAEADEVAQDSSEEALWDKLDNNDFSDFDKE